MTKRRAILKVGGTALALAGLGIGAAPASAAASGFTWSRAAAAAMVGQQFWVNHPTLRAVALQLDAVAAHASKHPSPRLDQFSLLFVGTGQPQMAAGTYDVEHPALGHFALYLAPVSGRGSAYRAEFNLLL